VRGAAGLPRSPRCDPLNATPTHQPAHHFDFLAAADGRLDMLVAAEGGLSRTQAATLIATGQVTVDGRREKASYRPRRGERVAVVVPTPPGRDIVPESIPLRIVYEDEWMLVVDKPAGMVVHPAPGHWTGTLVNALLGRDVGRAAASSPGAAAGEADGTADGEADGPAETDRDASSRMAPERAGIVHRLDKETSGLLLVARTDRVHRLLSDAIAQRRVQRRYAALAWGHLPEDRVTVDRPIGRDPRDRKRMAIVSSGRSARTDFVRLARFESTDLLRAKLYTGRTHQIRVHLASLGHPVVGDEAYAGSGERRLMALPPRRHFLHAAWLTLRHPISGDVLDLRSPLPPDLRASIAAVASEGEPIQAAADSESQGDADVLGDVGFYERDA
jgi:23S rRNA pseudouridine1911/1915/1917 synthase